LPLGARHAAKGGRRARRHGLLKGSAYPLMKPVNVGGENIRLVCVGFPTLSCAETSTHRPCSSRKSKTGTEEGPMYFSPRLASFLVRRRCSRSVACVDDRSERQDFLGGSDRLPIPHPLTRKNCRRTEGVKETLLFH
jgi:hypothetical protein